MGITFDENESKKGRKWRGSCQESLRLTSVLDCVGVIATSGDEATAECGHGALQDMPCLADSDEAMIYCICLRLLYGGCPGVGERQTAAAK